MRGAERLPASLAALALVLWGGVADAAEVWLRAEPGTTTMPDGRAVPIWGFVLDADQDLGTADGAASVPGPVISVDAADPELVVHLRNNLPEPVSFVIQGQRLVPSPTWTDGATLHVGARPALNVTARVRSFTTETAPGAVGTYRFTGLLPGTFLYQSGTHPALQVEMGLYGALRKDAVAGEAYAGVAYDREQVVVTSELDAELHDAVAAGDFGPGAPVTSTMGRLPRYFLVNGLPRTAGDPPLPAGLAGERLLLRVVNAGQEAHVPLLQGLRMSIVAQDGRPLAHPRDRHAAPLAAGRTLDAIVVAPSAGTFPLYDRRLRLAQGEDTAGGLLLRLEVE